METEETGVITRHQIPVMMSKKTVVLRASDFIRGYRVSYTVETLL